MDIGRPPTLRLFPWGKWIPCFGYVVNQSIEPDVDRLRVVTWDADSPGQPLHRPRDGEILKSFGHRVDNGWRVVIGGNEVLVI